MLWYTKGVDRMKKNWIGKSFLSRLIDLLSFSGIRILWRRNTVSYKRWSSRFLRTISFNSLLYVKRIHHSIVHSINQKGDFLVHFIWSIAAACRYLYRVFIVHKNHFLKQLTAVQKMVFVVLCISVILPALYEFITGFAQGFWERLWLTFLTKLAAFTRQIDSLYLPILSPLFKQWIILWCLEY